MPEQPLLLLSTLNGSLVGVDKKTGLVLWTVKEGECSIITSPLVLLYVATCMCMHIIGNYLSCS